MPFLLITPRAESELNTCFYIEHGRPARNFIMRFCRQNGIRRANLCPMYYLRYKVAHAYLGNNIKRESNFPCLEHMHSQRTGVIRGAELPFLSPDQERAPNATAKGRLRVNKGKMIGGSQNIIGFDHKLAFVFHFKRS